MKELICIVCPKGCHLKVDEENGYKVTGNGCERGIEYGKKELLNPTRVVTSTVAITGASLPRLPVKTDTDIPKKDILAIMDLINTFEAVAPVNCGDILIPNVLNTGANLVATRSLPKKDTAK